MISFDDYRQTYHSNVVDETELRHLKVEFDEQKELLSKLDISKDYTKEQLKEVLFSKKINSQTTFYRMRRGLVRLATISGFDFRIVHRINTIEFDEIFKSEDFDKEYFASIDDLCGEILKVQRSSPSNDRTGSMAVACLLWCGLTQSDITRLKDSNIDFNTNTIDYEDYNGIWKRVGMDKRSALVLRSYMDSRNSTNGYVFVGPSGSQAHKTTVNKMLKSMNDYSDRVFISKNITYSGWFWRIYHKKDPEAFPSKDMRLKYNKWVECFCNE